MGITISTELYEQYVEQCVGICIVCGELIEGVNPAERLAQCTTCERWSVYGIESLVAEGFGTLQIPGESLRDVINRDRKKANELYKRLRRMPTKKVDERTETLEEILEAGRPAPNKVDKLAEELRKAWFCE